MSNTGKKVVVGMSGGVDSAVTAYLLKEQGYEVIGVTLRVWDAGNGEDGKCCEIDDARRTAEILGIRYHPHNCTSLFTRCVIDPFVDAYANGMTPNPCIECNRYVKWEKLLELMNIFEADYVATGHYAYVDKLSNGRYTVRTADHAAKDQTYMLYKLTQDQLKHTLMPLGGLTKEEVRNIAKEAGLPCANKEDSQDICFVESGKHPQFIESRTTKELAEGNFTDEEGNILGRHKGIHHYTVGQRKGLGIALGFPAFVLKICPEDNTIVLGPEFSLSKDEIICRDVNLMSMETLPDSPLSCFVKTRYHQPVRPASLVRLDDGKVKVLPEASIKGVSPGQSCVFYDKDGYVIGGGIIDQSSL